ncbi:MAG: alpha/beta fold hydrolase [Alphaproteobacteria bacterium]
MRIVLAILAGLMIVAVIGLGLTAFVSRDLSPDHLETVYTSEQSRFVTVDGVRFHVQETGERREAGPSLVMIHGFGAHLQTWDGWVEALGDTYHIIRFDLPGHGLTGPDPSGDYTNERTIALVTDLLETLGVDRRVMIGNSLGGFIAWRHAAENPSKVAGQVLLAPGGIPFPSDPAAADATVPEWFALIEYIFPIALVQTILERLYAEPDRIDPRTVTRYHELIRRQGNRAALLQRMRTFRLEDPEPVLRSIETPTLLLWGRSDTLLPVEQAALFDEWLPNVATLRLPGVGHMPMEEMPELTVRAVKTFLRSLF